MDYPQSLEFLHSLRPESKLVKETLRIERISLLLKLLGNPQKKFKSVHVAGTAGKGSTTAICASVLQAHGLKVGMHVSPHLQVVNERMQVDGRLIGTEEFARLTERIEPLCDSVEGKLGFGRPTFYEATLAMAFAHFANEKCGAAVVETGLGGRLDATNVLAPDACAITNVHLDHTQLLGNTIAKIAAEKAGIAKKGVPLVTGAEGKALEVIEEKCLELKAPIMRLGKEIIAEQLRSGTNGSSFNLFLKNRKSNPTAFANLRLNLLGSHQVSNAALAIAAASKIVKLDGKKLRNGLKSVFVPGRLEIVQRNPLVILDGAHNPAKARALVEAARGMELKDLTMVMGISASKDAGGMMRQFRKLDAGFILTQGQGREFHNPVKLARLAGDDCAVENSVADAVNFAIAKAGWEGSVLVTGSLYVVGEARQRWLPNEVALKKRSLAI
ncbi:bifunctional folylpolyglutamate synthase/dihydrofolate synthase [Candidatus Micrarchaeota archaeon]|nr:bifunctional folylpolyglutamate synthase/dihydrofolate synthase [Candidatus Micrarchaeota archaeon]